MLATRAEVDAKEVAAAPEDGWGGGGMGSWAARLMYVLTNETPFACNQLSRVAVSMNLDYGFSVAMTTLVVFKCCCAKSSNQSSPDKVY